MTPVSSTQRVTAGALALLLHLGFFAALVFSVSWRQTPQAPVQAELWTRLPQPRVEAPLPQPLPPPQLAPEVPAEMPKAVAKPDIALKAREAEKRRLEEARQAEASKAAEAERRKEEERRRQAEEQRRAAEARKRAVEQALARQMQDEIASEDRQLAQMQQQAQAQSARQKLVDEYIARIQQKVRGHLRLPPSLSGNPEAVFRVDLLPDGEVIGTPVLVKTSGQPLYDREVERAILKASPLPLPPDREAAAAFRNGLVLKFRPFEAGR